MDEFRALRQQCVKVYGLESESCCDAQEFQCGGCGAVVGELHYPACTDPNPRLKGVRWTPLAQFNAEQRKGTLMGEPIVFEVDGKPRREIGTDYVMAYSAGVPTFEVERNVRRYGTDVTIFLPECDVMACQTVQEFKCLLANRVTPVLNELVAKWEKTRKAKEQG